MDTLTKTERKEADQFSGLLRHSAARIIAAAAPHIKTLTREAREAVFDLAVCTAWEHREEYSPEKESLPHWMAARFAAAKENYFAAYTEVVRERISALRAVFGYEPDAIRIERTDSDHIGAMVDIDREIEALDFPPHERDDCPICWECAYFEGLQPSKRRRVRMDIVEAEVAEAVAVIRERKAAIAAAVSDGTWRTRT